MRNSRIALVVAVVLGWSQPALPQSTAEIAAATLLQAAEADRADIASYALDKGAAVDTADRQGNTALAVAAKAGAGRVVALLLERGAKVDAAARDGWTALMQAAHQ